MLTHRRFRTAMHPQVGVRSVVRRAHGAHQEGLEEHHDRLGVVAGCAALLAVRDAAGQDQQVQAVPQAAQHARDQEAARGTAEAGRREQAVGGERAAG